MAEVELDPDNLPQGDHEAHMGRSFMPTDGLSYDPTDEVYWDRGKMEIELERAIEICHGCRMCFKYCSTFPILFDAIDAENGHVERLTVATLDTALDACFQCKLCEVQCPYTPREDHEFLLDFPALIHRRRAIDLKEKRVKPSFGDKLLANPDRAGALARASLGTANVAKKIKPLRVIQEKVIGIDRRYPQPDFPRVPFAKRQKKAGHVVSAPRPDDEAVLFPTCWVEHNDPELGQDVMDVLAFNSCSTSCRDDVVCCGMPAWEQGDLETLVQKAERNIAALLPHAEADQRILVVNPTCSMMLRHEYPRLLPERLRDDAAKVAAQVRDVSEHLFERKKDGTLNTDYQSTPNGTVAYHAPCHLRAQGIGFRGRDLMRTIPGVKPRMTMECSGHDGTYGLKAKSWEDSKKVGKKAFDGMKGHDADVWASDCPLSSVQFEQHTGRSALHPIQVLARAIKPDGFPTRIVDGEVEQT